MTRKLICMVLACVMMLGLVLTGCNSGTGKDTTAAATTAAASSEAANSAAASSAADTTAPAGTDLEEVTLTWYNASGAFRSDQYPQKLEVADYLSEYTHEKINAYIDYKWFDSADYQEKVSAAVNASQPMDVMFTSQSKFPFGIWQKRGAFADITDLIQEYAAETYTSIPEWVWKAVTVDGKLYGMPSYKDVAVTLGLIYNKTMAQELGIEEELLGMKWSVAKELDEFYYKVKEMRDAAHPDYADIPLNVLRDTMHIYYEADQLASIAYTSIPGTPSFTGEEYANGEKVFNVYASQEYMDAIAMVTRWVKDEIVPYDQKNWDTEKEIQKSGKMFSKYTWGLVAVNEDEFLNEDGTGYKQGLMQPAVAFTYTGYPQAVIQAISATSENPERAMMLLNLVFSDQTFSTTLRFGIEGKGWNRVQKDGVDRVDFAGTYNEDKQARGDNGFYYWYHAEQGNLFTCLLPLEQDDHFFEYLDAMNKSAAASVNMGFVLDTEAIDTEVSACASVISEYHDDLITGMEEDYEARIASFVEKLNANGAEKIIAEAQSQLDTWRAANK